MGSRTTCLETSTKIRQEDCFCKNVRLLVIVPSSTQKHLHVVSIHYTFKRTHNFLLSIATSLVKFLYTQYTMCGRFVQKSNFHIFAWNLFTVSSSPTENLSGDFLLLYLKELHRLIIRIAVSSDTGRTCTLLYAFYFFFFYSCCSYLEHRASVKRSFRSICLPFSFI
jgi:hypothetical protein